MYLLLVFEKKKIIKTDIMRMDFCVCHTVTCRTTFLFFFLFVKASQLKKKTLFCLLIKKESSVNFLERGINYTSHIFFINDMQINNFFTMQQLIGIIN